MTLVIPVHRGRERALARLLVTIAEAAPSACAPASVLIVSRDLPDLDTWVKPLARLLPIPVRTLVVPKARTLAEVRNAGLHAVTTEWVHFLDSDTYLAPDHFVRLERALSAHDPSIAGFQLNFAPAPSTSRWAQYEAEIDRWAIGRYIGEDRVRGLNGMGFLARVAVLRAVGGFDPELVAAEDIDLGYRLFRAGVPIVFLPEVSVFHEYPARWRDLLRRKFWHGQGYGLLLRRHPEFWSEISGSSWPSPMAVWRRPRFLAYVLIAHLVFLLGAGYALVRHAVSRRRLAPADARE
jgi:GT2 family glycosyltransferase